VLQRRRTIKPQIGIKTSDRGERGQAFVELALGLPLMLLIMLGTLDVGQLFIGYVQLRNGCREAASYGARHPTDTPGIETRVTAEDPYKTYTTTTVTVEIRGDLDVTSDSQTHLVVNCQRTFSPQFSGFFESFFGFGDIPLRSVATSQVQK
jgi:Flp pilus assembly protein TadG